MDLIKKKLNSRNISPEEKKLIEDADDLETLINIEEKIFNKKKKIALPLFLKIAEFQEEDEPKYKDKKNSKLNTPVYVFNGSDINESVNSNYGLNVDSRSSGYKSNGFVLYKL
jgi:hypothetical protein